MKLLEQRHFHYLGSFRLQRGSGAHRFGYGLDAMCCGRDGTLFVSGHRRYGLVAQVAIPSPEGTVRAPIVRDFFDPTPGEFLEQRMSSADLELDRLGDIAFLDGWLYSASYTYYGVEGAKNVDRPTLMRVKPGELEPGWPDLKHIGPWSDGKSPSTQKFTSGYMDVLPERVGLGIGLGFATPDWLLCGRGDGAGNASGPRCPSVVAIRPNHPEDAMALIWRDMKTDPSPPLSQWDPADEWSGMAWVEADDVGGLVFVGAKAMVPSWYGAPDMPAAKPQWFAWAGAYPDWQSAWRATGLTDPYRGGRGYHTSKRRVEVRVYEPNMLKRVVEGSLSPNLIAPYQTFALPQFHEAAGVRACCYDKETRRLYIGENWPIGREGTTYPAEDPRVHVYEVRPDEPEPESPEETEPQVSGTIRIQIEGSTWSGTVFKE